MCRGLDARLFSLPLVERLLAEGMLTEFEVIRVETARLASGLPLDQVESQIALLLSDESDRVWSIVGEFRQASRLEGRDHEVYLWLRLAGVRAQWDRLVDPQFYVEEILDTLDHERTFDEMRFFRSMPRKERTPGKYVSRVDELLERRRSELNRDAGR